MKYVLKYCLFALCFLFFFESEAQLCTGSLGDPVVNIDFGAGSGRGSALESSITSYSYSSSGFPNDGYYTIANSTSGLLSSWWTTTDHTGNTNGYMMIVNASLSVTDYFYKTTVTGLCPGTVYEFSAWVLNLFNNGNSVYPNLTFSIIDPTTNAVLNTYNSGDIVGSTSSVKWQQCGFYFTSTTNSVIIKITNNKAGAAPGNDLALDDITFRPCGAIATVSVQNNSSTSLSVCEGNSISYTLNGSLSSSNSTTQYQWQQSTDNGTTWIDIAGATTLNYTVSGIFSAGTYLYRLAFANNGGINSSNCRIVSNNITFTVNTAPTNVSYSVVQPKCFGEKGSVTIYAPTGTGFQYSIDGINYQLENTFQDLPAGNYNLVVKSSGGCFSSAYPFSIIAANPTPTPVVDVAQPLSCTDFGTIKIDTPADYYSFDNGQNWQTSNIKSNLIPGTYNVKIMNVSLCESDAVEVVINTPSDTPVITMDSEYYFCPESSIILNAGSGFSSYTWFLDNNHLPEFDNQEKVELTITGNYTVTVTNNLGCSVSKEIQIKNYEIPDSISVTINNNTATILALPSDNYEYSLDGSNWQASNIFVNLANKIYNAYVKTEHGCIVISNYFSIFNIPNVITPNQDGINDYWQINGIEVYPGSVIQVFDRYGGKVYEKIINGTFQWDGTQFGRPLPTANYWYLIKITDGRIFNGSLLIKNRN